MPRLGLCCVFVDQPIKFKTITAGNLHKISPHPNDESRARLGALCEHNLTSLQRALVYCASHQIGDFRIQSGLWPLKTHPVFGYELSSLPNYQILRESAHACRSYAAAHNIRTTIHPDQFVVLSSPHPQVVAGSLRELEYQAELADFLGADVINLHCGGAYGDKPMALRRLRQVIEVLPAPVVARLTLENDDRSYRPAEVIPLCQEVGIPFVYDVHHHRCLESGVTTDEIKRTTEQALATWNREPVFHLSSPAQGWEGKNPCYHSDYIDYADFPADWKELDITIEIEAKAKELAIARLYNELAPGGAKRPPSNRIQGTDPRSARDGAVS